MIKVNLVPSEILAKAKHRQLLLQAVVLGGLMGLVLVVVSVGHWYGKHMLEITLAVDEAEFKRLDRVVTQVEELEKAAAAVRSRLSVIENLLLGRAYYPIFMSEFARSVPAGIKGEHDGHVHRHARHHQACDLRRRELQRGHRGLGEDHGEERKVRHDRVRCRVHLGQFL